MDGELCLDEDRGFVTWLSSLTKAPECRFYSLRHSSEDPLPRAEFSFRVELPGTMPDYRLPSPETAPHIVDYFSASSQQTHYALIIRWVLSHSEVSVLRVSQRVFAIQCSSMSTEVCQQPTLRIYPGPGAQIVRQSWGASVHLQKFAQLGYVVIAADGRGSDNRGMRTIIGDFLGLFFQAPIKGHFGPIEVHDQVN